MEIEKLNRIKAVLADSGKQGKWLAFTREYYCYTAPRQTSEIFELFRGLGEREQELISKIIDK